MYIYLSCTNVWERKQLAEMTKVAQKYLTRYVLSASMDIQFATPNYQGARVCYCKIQSLN